LLQLVENLAIFHFMASITQIQSFSSTALLTGSLLLRPAR
jgi:hypothetical protein